MTRATLGSIELHYEERGDGFPLVMILGLGQDTPTWGFQIPELSKHFRIVVFDNRDSGQSSRSTGDYSVQDMAEDALALMDFLGIERSHLLGVSLGGMIAQQMAAVAPQRVGRLILASTTSWGKG